MKKTVFLKRVLFWLESSISIVIVLVGVAILVWVFVAGLVVCEMGAWLQEIGAMAAHFVKPMIRILFTELDIALTTMFWVSVYIGTMVYFAQTEREKRIGKYLIPLTLGSLPVCAFLGYIMVFAGLASQGAGQ